MLVGHLVRQSCNLVDIFVFFVDVRRASVVSTLIDCIIYRSFLLVVWKRFPPVVRVRALGQLCCEVSNVCGPLFLRFGGFVRGDFLG